MLLFVFGVQAYAQHDIAIDATLNPLEATISIAQEVTFRNTASKALDTLYFKTWWKHTSL